jgi:hypothetical protein
MCLGSRRQVFAVSPLPGTDQRVSETEFAFGVPAEG